MELDFTLDRLAQADRVVWLLDYDGTLVPFADRPDLATPDAAIINLLGQLSAISEWEVHIVSGRQREWLERWLGRLPIGMHAEHGLWSRSSSGEWQMNLSVDVSWKESVRLLFQEFARRTPGVLIEDKDASITWHYRMADPTVANRHAQRLEIELTRALEGGAAEVLTGNKVIEVKPSGVNKGRIAARLVSGARQVLAVAIGDDQTDEFMFRALPDSAISICVGSRRSRAQYRLPDVAAVRAFLGKAVECRGRRKWDAFAMGR